MKRSRKIFGVLLILILVQLSCAVPAGFGNSNIQETEVVLRIKETMLAQQQQTLDAGGEINNIETTHTPHPTITARPPTEIPPTKTAAPKPDDEGDAFTLLSETVPDGTFFTPGEHFTKTWTIRNDSGTTWNKDFIFTFAGGDHMPVAGVVPLGSTVAPGAEITLSAEHIAPNTPGQYNTQWVLFSDEGEKVGLLSTSIIVGEYQAGPGFLTIDVSFPFENKSINMVCPDSVKVVTNITTNTAGTISCTWLNSSQADGGQVTQDVTFAGAMTRSITYMVGPIGSSGTYDVHFYCENEGMQWDYGPIPIHVTCQ